MTSSEVMLAMIRAEIKDGPCARTKLAYLAGELATEYELALAAALRLEQAIHRITK